MENSQKKEATQITREEALERGRKALERLGEEPVSKKPPKQETPPPVSNYQRPIPAPAKQSANNGWGGLLWFLFMLFVIYILSHLEF